MECTLPFLLVIMSVVYLSCKLLNTFNKIFNFTIIFSAIVSGWTSILLFSNTTFDLEIKEVINRMYLNQRDFIFNVKELSFLLVKDANERFSEINQDITPMNKKEN